MPDVKVNVPGTGTPDLDYAVPGNSEFLLKQAFASFDGSGAGASWLPTLQLIGPDGNVAGEYFPDTPVAAGVVADTTFGPFLRGAAASVTPTSTSLPFAMASDISSTLVAGTTVTADLADWFGTTDSSVFSTRVVGGKTWLNVKEQGFYRLQICCIAQNNTVTGPLGILEAHDSPSATVDTTEFDVGQLFVSPVTAGGTNRYLVNTNTYVAVPAPAGAAFTAHINCGGLSGNIAFQHTDVVLVREGDYVANVLF